MLKDQDIGAFRALLKETLGQLLTEAGAFRFEQNDPQQLLAMCLYATSAKCTAAKRF